MAIVDLEKASKVHFDQRSARSFRLDRSEHEPGPS